jgi:hypothetical protein
LKILVTAGVSTTPIVSILPAKWLIEIINLDLAQDVAGRLLEVVAQAMDGRMKEATTGDANYQLGPRDQGKALAVDHRGTGKESYKMGRQ